MQKHSFERKGKTIKVLGDGIHKASKKVFKTETFGSINGAKRQSAKITKLFGLGSLIVIK